MNQVDVVIVTYNSIHVIDDLLDSLPAAFGDISFSVVVVDNSSADGTGGYLEARGGCQVVRSANAGYAAGINRGVRAGTGAPAILVLNPDVRLGPASVPPMLAALAAPGVGIVAPQIRSPQGVLEMSLRREPSLLRAAGLTGTKLAKLSEYVSRAADYRRPGVADWALGAVLLMSRRCFDELGGWDESYFLYSEEADLCLRARDRGLSTRYEPAAVAVHIGGQSGRSRRTHTMQIVNRVRLYRRRHGAARAWCYYCLTAASELSWLLRGHGQSWAAVVALLRPSARPAELACGDRLMPY